MAKKTKASKTVSGPELKVGVKAPAFKLKNQDGELVSLSDFKGQNVILYFYPKDLTPGCTVEACDFRDSFNRLKKLKVIVLGVSKDKVALHKKFVAKHDLNFSLLSDEDGSVCEAYKVFQEKSLYGKKYMGIVRTTYWIGPDQKIKKVYAKVKVAGHVDEILTAIQGE